MSVAVPAGGNARQLAFEFARPRRKAPSRRTSDNVYFAVLPDPDAAQCMREIGLWLWDRYRLPGRVQPARLLHVSIAHVGHFAEVPDGILAAARTACASVRCAPFEVCFDRVHSFDNARGPPVVLRCGYGDAGFAGLRRTIATSMLGAGLRANPSAGLTPHVTLVYNGLPISETPLGAPIRWTVREFVLVRSLYGRGRHVHLGRWKLAG